MYFVKRTLKMGAAYFSATFEKIKDNVVSDQYTTQITLKSVNVFIGWFKSIIVLTAQTIGNDPRLECQTG